VAHGSSNHPIRTRQHLLWNGHPDLFCGFKIDHCLPDHLIRSLKHADWNCQTDLIGCLEIDDELELRRLLDWQITRLCALKNLIYIVSRSAEQVIVVHPVRHQTALIDKPFF
jgi:hypothetical protein